MAIAVTVNAASVVQSNSQRFQEFVGTLTIGGGSYVSGGVLLDSVLVTALQPQSSSGVPIWADFQSVTGSGFVYQRVAGGSPPEMGLQIFQVGESDSPLAEIDAGALPSGVTSDVIAFRVAYNRNV